MASEQNLDSLDEPGFERLRGLLHSCVSWEEMNILRDSKKLHIRQELLSNPVKTFPNISIIGKLESIMIC